MEPIFMVVYSNWWVKMILGYGGTAQTTYDFTWFKPYLVFLIKVILTSLLIPKTTVKTISKAN